MPRFPRWARILGLILNVLVGGLMIFAGSEKVFGFAPPEITKKWPDTVFPASSR